MSLFRLALASLWSRRLTAAMVGLAVACSVALLLGVEKLRESARASFAGAISGTDVIVGARTGDVQLLLYAVFRIGEATNNLSWESYQDIAARPEVDWIAPLSLGDSHRGFRVVGTNRAFFEQYRHRRDMALSMREGAWISDLFDAVIGAEVAEKLGYRTGDAIVVQHGAGKGGLGHDDKPFRVSGVLARTGTPVDDAVYVSLEAITAIHVDWVDGAPVAGLNIAEARLRGMDLTPETVTAALVGLKSRLGAFRFQRFVNDYPEEPLTAILPGVALTRLWSLVGVAEQALAAVSMVVVVTALVGLVAAFLAALQERRREMAILRANGAGPATIAGLLMAEAMLLTAAGAAAGMAFTYLILAVAAPLLGARFGLILEIAPPSAREWAMMAAVVAAGALAGLIPAWRAYRVSLADGVTVRS